MNHRKLFFTRSIKSLASVAKNNFGLPIASLAPNAVNILAYHRVVADIAKAEREAIYGLVVSQETFRRHCEMLKKAFKVVSLDTAAQFLDGRQRSERPLAVITFDDGYLDFYTVAFPVLLELDLPATNFLPTEFIGGDKILAHDKIFWLLKTAWEKQISIAATLIEFEVKVSGKSPAALCEALIFQPHKRREEIINALETLVGGNHYPAEYRLLDWEQIHEMRGQKMDFGFHTANHSVLTTESDADLENEIFAGKLELEKRLNQKVVSFAYPNGAFNPRVRQKIADAGFTIAVTTKRKTNRVGADLDALTLGRISLCEESTRGINGAYSPSVAKLRLRA